MWIWSFKNDETCMDLSSQWCFLTRGRGGCLQNIFAKLMTCVDKRSVYMTVLSRYLEYFYLTSFSSASHAHRLKFFFLRRTYKIIIFCNFMSTVNVYQVIYIRFVCHCSEMPLILFLIIIIIIGVGTYNT